jgi:hypothetical protein
VPSLLLNFPSQAPDKQVFSILDEHSIILNNANIQGQRTRTEFNCNEVHENGSPAGQIIN